MIERSTMSGIFSTQLVAALALLLTVVALGCGGAAEADMVELQRLKSGDMDVVVLAPQDGLKNGSSEFLIEFRSNGTLTDVGDVRASSTMPMPGMPMFGSIDVQHTDVTGRYRAKSEFSMAGTWQIAIEWNGPEGRRSVSFSSSVQ